MTTTTQIQQHLNEVMGSKLAVDGDFGPKTKSAVAMFQASRGLVADGVVGPKTLAALFPPGIDKGVVQSDTLMRTSPAGRAAIMAREGVRLHSYQDSVGVLTIGVGHTTAAGPPVVRVGMVISSTECDEILSRDLARFEAGVSACVKVAMTQNQFDAMVSLAFNIGGGAFSKSSVVKRLNAGDKAGAAEAFLMWDKAGGRVEPGLVTRRELERKQFLA